MIILTDNGMTHRLNLDPEMPLLWAPRDHLHLTGTKCGCSIAQCGACTIHVDGRPVRACRTRLADVNGSEITTIEVVGGSVAEAVRDAWRGLDVCNADICHSGQIMAAIGLLTETRGRPTRTSAQPWMATSVAAAPISGSARPSTPRPDPWPDRRMRPC
jgi:isoquinoline 1-oxidoreductase subunit alpha